MKQAQVLFIVLLSLVVLRSSAQTQPDLDAWLRGFFTEANLPYRDLNGGISIQYKPGSNHDLVFAALPKGALDQGFIQQASLALKDLLVSANSPALDLKAGFRFDDLTDTLFLTRLEPVVVVNNDNRNNIFVSPSTMPVEAPGGTTAFLKRLNTYLLQLPDSVQQQVKGHAFRFDVEGRGGILTPLDSTTIAKYLNPFLVQEKKWKPAIRCGRPIKTKASLIIKIEPKREEGQYIPYSMYDLLLEEYVMGLEDQKIMYKEGYDQRKDPYSSISFVNYNGKANAFVYHRGSLADCTRMEEQVKASDYFDCYSYGINYPRLEFYRYLEE